MYVDTQEALDELVAIISEAEFLVIDTEFLHEKTYYPQLCLIQIATDNHKAIIDPFAPLDLRSLTQVLTDERILKVFHAGDQDRIILYQLISTPVRPIFDLQRAVLLLGQPMQMSLANIVRQYCDVCLEKTESFSDWSIRPLSEAQISYAFDDVGYLPIVYKKVVRELTELGRLEWLLEDFKALENESLYVTDDYDRWRKLKGVRTLRAQQLSVARELCFWREAAARDRDLPRKWLVSDDLVVEICRRMPDTLEELHKIRGLKRRLGQKLSNEVLASVAKGKKTPLCEWPEFEDQPRSDNNLPFKLDLMNALLHLRSKEYRIASTYLACHDEMVRLATGEREGLNILTGWRAELIGKEFLRLLNGELALSLHSDGLKVTLISQAGV